MASQRGVAARPETAPSGAGPEERRLAGSPHATAANAAVLALARAARSFTLYDPANKVVRTLIADYREKLERILAAHGPLALEVHPFELLLGSEVVYVEQDRERSLSFRLFRDGVRRIAFEPGATWEELLRLLQVLSIRFTAVRQQEDDLVTLLRKADFDHISIAAIEGFVPEEVSAERAPLPLQQGPLPRYEPPAQWDLPLPPFQEMVPLRYRVVPQEILQRLRDEESPESLPREAARAVVELLRLAEPTEREAALAFALEVRDYLLVERRVDLVGDLARAILQARSGEEDAGRGFLASYLDGPTLDAMVDSLPSETPPAPAVLDLLDAAPAEAGERLLDRLTREGDGPRAALLRALVVHAFRREPQVLTRRLAGAHGPEAASLLRLLAETDPDAARRRAAEAGSSTDVAVQREALRQLAQQPLGPETARVLRELVHSPHEEVRVGAFALWARGGARAFATLQAEAEKRVAALSTTEADALGRALAQASPPSALTLFEAWLRPKAGGLLGRLAKMHATVPQQRIALAGLAQMSGPQAAPLLELLAAHGESSVAHAASEAMRARRGREQGT